jgi:hypothetical protein
MNADHRIVPFAERPPPGLRRILEAFGLLDDDPPPRPGGKSMRRPLEPGFEEPGSSS